MVFSVYKLTGVSSSLDTMFFSNTPETGGCYEYNFKENTISFERGPRSERGPGSARTDLFQGKFC